ncbi:MAG: GAF domain-containing sensor histidine kinase [Solirubrobacteraceae bacterium]
MIQDENTLRRLLDAGRALVTELDPDAVLDQILEAAREITGARYAALGVLNYDRTGLARFLSAGVDPETQRLIGELPVGRGVLGELIERPEVLRLQNVDAHPNSYGFPPEHPVMHRFLGVPILIRGEAWGNLYLTEKPDGAEFTDEDEDAAVILAGWAATAIENARLHHASEQRRAQMERAVLGLEAARDITDAIGAGTSLEQILELIVKRGRALVQARTILILLREGEDLVVAASAGEARNALGRRVPVATSIAGGVLGKGQSQLLSEIAKQRLQLGSEDLGMPGARTALLVPMLHHGRAVGVLAAFDRGPQREPFTSADEQTLRPFASTGASAVVVHRSVEADRLRSTIAAADQERARWARELHDETLQALGGLRVLLAAALRRRDPVFQEDALTQSIAEVEHGIANLRAIISDLRPSLLDDFGLLPALEALLERRRADGLEIDSRLVLGPNAHRQLSKELETATYRVVQEALTNVVKHAQAASVRVLVELGREEIVIAVSDDGRGFDTRARTKGSYGLAGMRERVYLSGGAIEVRSGEAGTDIRVRLPARERRKGDGGSSVADQLVS